MSRLKKVIGTEIINDIRVGHTFYEVEVLTNFILDEQPDIFFEVGVHEGGLSFLLIPKLPSSCYYTGVELHCSLIRPMVMNMYYTNNHASLICVDCFHPTIYTLMSSSHKKIIYCDGGNKAKEIEHFKDTCIPGDIIMCHDFYDGTRVVRDVPVENISIEVTACDIRIFENDPTFDRLPEEIFGETRIIGWRKNGNR